MSIIYLAVPFEEKDEVKKLGAKWDNNEKKWYILDNLKNKEILLEKYKINNNPIILDGEDRNYCGNELFVDLIPRSCWFSNVRSCVHITEWDRIRNYIYTRVNYICECCGINTKENNIQLEAHERWSYDETTYTQKLVRIIALCQQCHQTTHIGLAGINGKTNEAENHLKKIRRFSDEECELHIKEAFTLWNNRNKYLWNLDLSLMENNGIKLSRKINKDERLNNVIENLKNNKI